MDDYSAWVGRSETREDVATAAPLAGLAALLDHDVSPWTAGTVPPLGHWLYFLPAARQSVIGEDGHPRRDSQGLLPPVPLPRRMWAGSRLDFLTPIVVTRVNAAPQAPTPVAPAEPADATRSISPDPVLLFRYSALTFNAHRIHYDRDYARDVEGYAGLVVHGPLIATLLMDHAQRAAPDIVPRQFAFRAEAPLIDGTLFDLCLARDGEGAKLWARDVTGRATMRAKLS